METCVKMLKVGDSVKVAVTDPANGWGLVKLGDIGTVSSILADGTAYVKFQAQRGWRADPGELELVNKKVRKSPEKVLAYAVLKQGELHKVVQDRDVARSTKAKLGGKLAGATIVVLQAGKEIR
jgi:hypothetical protein